MLASILNEIQASLAEKSGRLLSFGLPVIVIGVLISVFQQFVGINAVLYYAPQMFSNMGASTDTAMLQTVIVGGANVIFTVVAIVTVDKWGRKPLLVTGALIMAAAMIALGCLFNAQSVGLAALVAVVVYIAGFALSWGPVAWVMLSEMFPNSIKSKAMGLAVAAQWIANLAGVHLLQGHRRQFRVERDVQSRFCLLDLRRHERPCGAVCDPVCAGDQGPPAWRPSRNCGVNLRRRRPPSRAILIHERS